MAHCLGSVSQCTVMESDYYQGLDVEARIHYEAKFSDVGEDPYLITCIEQKAAEDCSISELPDFSYPDLYMYVIKLPGYSAEVLKQYKSSDAYKYFCDGWVRSLMVCKKKEKFIITSKVNQSEDPDKEPLGVWVLFQPDGVVVSSHCTCMTGLGEVCSHMVATLFAIDACVRIQRDTSCSYLEYFSDSSCDDDFSTPVKRNKTTHDESGPRRVPVPAPTAEEMKQFYKKLYDSGVKSVILSVLPEYCEEFRTPKLPPPLTDLYDEENTHLAFSDLLDRCSNTFSGLTVTPDQARLIEEQTRGHIRTRQRLKQETGRITASTLKSVCQTKLVDPPLSLIRTICYPDTTCSNEGTKWDCNHKSTSWKLYEELHKLTHKQAELSTEVGLNINPLYPHMGATPAGYVTCGCCGDGIVEVMCSLCFLKTAEEENPEVLDFCLHQANGCMRLKTDHEFYYQVQAQLHITKKKYCDFVVSVPTNIHVERVFPNEQFWQKCVESSKAFYIFAVLPELTVKWYSRQNQPTEDENLTEPFCYCRSATNGVIVKCQSDTCKIKKFHLTCQGLKVFPKKPWLCTECRTLSKAAQLEQK